MSNTLNQTAVERADALLTRWGQRLSAAGTPPMPDEIGQVSTPLPPSDGAMPPEVKPEAIEQADTLLGRVSHRLSGRGLVEAAAYGYVALAIRTGRVANAAQKTWQESVQEARRQQEQQAAQAGGPRAARQVAADEKKGEQVLKQTETDVESDAAEGVNAAADVAA